MYSSEYIKKLEEDDKRYIWHPFTQMQEYRGEDPVIICGGNGCTLRDVHGKEYIDGVSSVWTNVHGHRKEKLDNALKSQIDRISHSSLLGLTTIPAIEFSRILAHITPEGLTHVFYSDNGSTAVEVALKIAFQFHQQAKNGNKQKTKFISFKNAYHGDTIGSVSVGGIDLFHEVYRPLLFDTIKVEAPYCYRCPFGKEKENCAMDCINHIEETMKINHQHTAALVIEPLIFAAAGMITQPKGFLSKIRSLCTKYGILLIADEVATGFGKTGKMFACETEDVVPDIIALSKGITGGYIPLAATITNDEIYNAFLGSYDEYKTFYHGHTFTGNPLGCALGIANLEIFNEENIIEELRVKIDFFAKKLKNFAALPSVGDIRQTGIMTGIELVRDRTSREGFPIEERLGHKVILEARAHGVLIRPLGNVIVLMPPLSITIDELDRLCDITYRSIEKVTGAR
jgi:adenosylmethionine---8-amino-7-oxononanoate aminotransferase